MYFGYAWNRIGVIETKRAENMVRLTNSLMLFKKISILEYQIYPYPFHGFKAAKIPCLPLISFRPNLEWCCTRYAILIPL